MPDAFSAKIKKKKLFGFERFIIVEFIEGVNFDHHSVCAAFA